jgi:hypothetical protein
VRVALILAGTLLMMASCHQQTSMVEPEISGVVHVTGMGELRFGEIRANLEEHLSSEMPGCNVQLKNFPQGSAVFDEDGRLAVMWFEAPMRTPQGVMTGVSVGQAKETYPGARELEAPENTRRFDGLLVLEGEHGYLFLHDGAVVQKAIAGYVTYLDRLFNTGFGVC